MRRQQYRYLDARRRQDAHGIFWRPPCWASSGMGRQLEEPEEFRCYGGADKAKRELADREEAAARWIQGRRLTLSDLRAALTSGSDRIGYGDPDHSTYHTHSRAEALALGRQSIRRQSWGLHRPLARLGG